MTEPTKEQVEKWRSEFEDDLRFTHGNRPMQWQGYLAAKKSDFEKISKLENDVRINANRENLLHDLMGELEKLENEIKTLKEQLAEAESVLGYYGNSESYYVEYRGDHLCRNVICKDDISSIEKIRDPHNGRIAIKYCGGKRARQYFAEKEKQDKVKVSSNESN